MMRDKFSFVFVCFLCCTLLSFDAFCQNAPDSVKVSIDTISSTQPVPAVGAPVSPAVDTNVVLSAPVEAGKLPDTSSERSSTPPPPNPPGGEVPPAPVNGGSTVMSYPTYSDTSPARPIDVRFVKYKSYNAPDSAFFNVLKIKNNTDKAITFTPKINVPEGWNHLFWTIVKMTLNPGDSAYVPIRVIIPRYVKGDVTYIISALLLSNEGKSIERGYSYVTIPKVTNWKVSTPNKVIYLNNLVEHEKFGVNIQNAGNGEEKLKLEIKAGRDLYLFGSRDGLLTLPVNIPPHTDTVIYFQVSYQPVQGLNPRLYEGWLNSSIQVKASDVEISSSSTLWFKYIENSFTNTIGKGESPLNVILATRNLLTNSKPQFNAGFFGSINFCNQRTIQYRFMNPSMRMLGIDGISYGNYLWKYTQMTASYSTPVYKIILGDQSVGYHHGVYGRGIGGEYKFKSNLFTGGVVQNIFYPTLGASLTHAFTDKLGPLNGIRSGVTFSDDTYNKIRAFSAATGSSVNLLKGHSIGIMLGASTKKHYFTTQDFINPVDPLKSFFGYAGGLTYASKVNKLLFDFNSEYYSKHYAAGYTERLNINGRVGYVISQKYMANLRAGHLLTNPEIYITGQLIPENKYSSNTLALSFDAQLTKKITAYAGPSLEFSKQLRYNGIIGDDAEFASLSERLSARINYHPDQYTSITPFFTIGWTQITQYSDSLYNTLSNFVLQNAGQLSPYFNVSTGLSIRQRMWGINAYYYYGPYNLYSQEAFFFGGNFHRSIRIMPYYEKYFLNNKLRLYTYNSYLFDVGPNAERINLGLRMDYFLNKGWSIFSNASMNFYSRYDEDGTKFNSRSYYFDFGVKKVFDIPQPCVKYYDLKVIFFADLNGNKSMDENERGLSYILTKVDMISKTDSIPQPNKEPIHFVSVELISDKYGEIKYIDIPTGNYELKIFPLTSINDLYSVLGDRIPFVITGDLTLYVPFAVSNRVKGKIIVNRDAYSTEGSISAENIRITAIDTLSNSYFTLTDKDGNYVLQVPQAGTYRITTNSEVFGDNFYIEQDEFLVDFNGFKEYEVIFKFTEKNRAININGDTAKLPGSILNGRNVNGHTGSTTTGTTSSATTNASTSTTSTTSTTTSGTTSGTSNSASNISSGGDSSIASYPTVMDTIIVETGTPPSGIGATGAANNPKMFFYALPIGEGITYRVQLSASSSRIAPSKLNNKFPGASKIKEYSEGGYYKYTSGEFTVVDDVKKHKTELRAKGFKDAFIVAFKNNTRIR